VQQHSAPPVDDVIGHQQVIQKSIEVIQRDEMNMWMTVVLASTDIDSSVGRSWGSCQLNGTQH